MNLENQTMTPTLTVLSNNDKSKILSAAFEVLEEMGQLVSHPQTIELLKKNGFEVDDEGVVKIPAKAVRQAIRTVPNSVKIYNRDGELAMDLGGRRSYYGNGSDLIFAQDPGTRDRHQSTLEDAVKAARVADALPNIDFIMSFAHPHEIDPKRAYLVSFQTMVENSIKPIVNIADNLRDLTEIWEVSKVIRGSEAALKEKPYWVHYDEPNSPMKHPANALEKLIFCAEKEMPMIYSPAPIAGSSAPITIAGHIVQGLSESLFGLVVHQLVNPGAPFLMGMGPAVLDMANGQCSYNAPEYLMSYMGIVEMAKFLDIPNWGYAGTSDAQLPDGQATYEAGLETFIASTLGSNLNHDVGYIDFGLTGSLEMMVIVDEIIDQVRRMQRGIVVNDEELALDAISDVRHKGNYLGHPHTLKHFRNTQWRPQLLTRPSYQQWEKKGSQTLLERTYIRLQDILENHQSKPLPVEMADAVNSIVDSYQPE